MAFPSNLGTKKDTLQSAWDEARGIAGSLKTQAQALVAQSLAGPVNSTLILDFLTKIANAKIRLQADAAVPGIGAYVQAQTNDAVTDIPAAFTALISQMDAVRDWMITNFPAAGGFIQAQSFDANGQRVDRTFSTATLATFRTQLTNLIAAID